jgi:predicted RNA-binding protein with PUA-like domain
MTASGNSWLLKSEAADYSIDDLARDGTTLWTGIRNYQARNFIRDGMEKGDLALYYHTGGTAPSIVGVARVAGVPVPDPTQFDRKNPYYDPKSPPDAPRWWSAPLEFVERLPRSVTLQELKADPRLADMSLLTRPRLSVHPVTGKELATVLSLGGAR